MSPSVRNQVGSGLQVAYQHGKGSLLYGMLIVGKQLITILRPKKHSFHPSGNSDTYSFCKKKKYRIKWIQTTWKVQFSESESSIQDFNLCVRSASYFQYGQLVNVVSLGSRIVDAYLSTEI
jgi:hypothetical protein